VNERRRLLLAACAAMGLAAADHGYAETAKPVAHTMIIDAFEFKPPTLTVDRGDTIVWRNSDPVPHTVTAKGAFDSGAIAAGATWKYTAKTSGRFDYICAFHPTMKGTLIVR
jgi:plastocyanin